MTIFSVVLIGIIVLFLMRKRNRTVTDIYISLTALTAILEIMMSIGYFVRIGNIEIGYSEFLTIINAILCVFLIGKKGFKNSYLNKGILLILVCVISLLFQIIFPYNGSVVSSSAGWDMYYFKGVSPKSITIGLQHIKEIIHVVCYVVILQQYFMLNNRKKEILVNKIFVFSKPFIWYGIVEFCFVKILNLQSLFSSFTTAIFGDSYSLDGAIVSLGVTDRLRGLKSEPSMYGFALFIFFAFSIVLYLNYRKKSYKTYAIISMLLMISSKSFTVVVCLFGLLVYWMLKKYKDGSASKRKSIVVGSSVLIVISLFLIAYFYQNDFTNYYLNRIHLALINLNDLSITGWTGDYASYDGSTKIRMISIVGTLKYFMSRPLLGLALGSTYAHSTMATVLASIGILGVIAWWRFTFYSEKAPRKRIYFISTLIWVVLLVLLDNGLFPFYGTENILIIYAIDTFIKGRKSNDKNESVPGLFASVS